MNDANLASWVLELAGAASPQYAELARGETTLADATLYRLDPALYANGFYRLRLTARDVAGRISQTETLLQIDSAQKSARYLRRETDLSVVLDGVTVEVVRAYDSLEADTPGRQAGKHHRNRHDEGRRRRRFRIVTDTWCHQRKEKGRGSRW